MLSVLSRPSLPLLLTLLLSLSAGAAPTRKTPRFPDREPDAARVERVLQSLSLREKVGQLLLAYPQVGKDTRVEVGGVLFVGGTLRKLNAARERIHSSRERARVPPFFAVDIEGGGFNRLQRHAALQKLPSAQELAAMEDAEVEAWGGRVGKAMLEMGLNMNLAPVFDVAPSGHMFRNGRAFSGDPVLVQRKATAFARGLARAGVAAIGKHFPGYGDLDADSDHVRALVALAHEGGGITVTDDVAIAALAEHLGTAREEVVRRAFLAGNDLILTTEPPDWSGGLDYFGILTTLAQSDPKHLEQ